MKIALGRIRRLFPGKAFYLLILSVVATFMVGLFDLMGVAAILPIIQIAMGDDISSGYLGILHNIMGNPDRNTMVIYTSVFLVLAFIVKAVLSLAVRWWSTGFLARQQTAAATRILESYMKDTYLNHRKRQTADIMRSTSEATGQAYGSYVGGILGIIGESATIIFLMGLLIVIMPLHAGVAFIYFIAATYILQKVLKQKNMKAGHISLEMSWKVSNATLDAVAGFRENRMAGVTDRRVYEYQDSRLRAVQAGRLKNFYQDLPKYLLEIVFIIGIAMVLALMVITDGIESAAYLLVFAGACIRILPSFVRMTASLGVVRSGIPSMDLMDKEMKKLGTEGLQLIDSEPSIGDFSTVNKGQIDVALNVERLSFQYPDSDEEVLKNLTFGIPGGSSIAFVGGSGSGKTTLVDLILGLFEPTSGSITFNDKSVHENIAEWHNLVGYVPQDVYLSSKSVLEEVAYGLRSDEIDENRVWEVIRIAELEEVVNSLEAGINTRIGERGTRLSGGQRQRLGIARALYRNPSILILDEATSALDNETEHKITQTINKIARDITVIIVAHRLSTVREVDQLLFMGKGQILAQGSFEEVRATNADFARLVELGQLPE